MMETLLSYFEDTYKFQERAMILAHDQDENGPFIVLDRTIFYPQGGGQPSDRGMLQNANVALPIHHVKSINGQIRHYTDKSYHLASEQEVLCAIDQEARLLHAKLHTAGHLISNIIEDLYPGWVGMKGHHFPGQAYVEFHSKEEILENVSIEPFTKRVKECIECDYTITTDQVSKEYLSKICPNFPYAIPGNHDIRIVRIGDFPFAPCGGTHIKSLRELNRLEITKSKMKNKVLKINYDMLPHVASL